ncbi:MAG: hypothetical protein H6Q43_2950, partial [Deltaproteobacteria bacterium]|nr:hypothetical protein [Deltaproteobacteria bacterium]
IPSLTLVGFLLACTPGRNSVVSPSPPAAPSSIEAEIKKETDPRQDLIVLLPEADGKVGKIRVTAEGGSEVIDQAWVAVQVKESGTGPLKLQPAGETEIQDVFGPALAAQPDLPNRFTSFFLWFESDTTKLKPASKKDLERIVKTIKDRKSAKIYLTGHTDREGSERHNLKLSSKRAFFVRDSLISKGIPSGAFFVSYHGETMPLVYTDDGVAEPQNRRVEVFIK